MCGCAGKEEEEAPLLVDEGHGKDAVGGMRQLAKPAPEDVVYDDAELEKASLCKHRTETQGWRVEALM